MMKLFCADISARASPACTFQLSQLSLFHPKTLTRAVSYAVDRALERQVAQWQSWCHAALQSCLRCRLVMSKLATLASSSLVCRLWSHTSTSTSFSASLASSKTSTSSADGQQQRPARGVALCSTAAQRRLLQHYRPSTECTHSRATLLTRAPLLWNGWTLLGSLQLKQPQVRHD